MFCNSESVYEDNDDYKYYEIKQKIYRNIFEVITKDYIPYTAKKINCKKCKELDEKHFNHMTKLEVLKDKISREILENIKMREGKKE